MPTDPETDKTETSPAGLRATIERLEAKLEAKEATIRELSFKIAGVDPTKGIGKAVAATFQGDMTPEAIIAYAKAEYEWTPPEAAKPEPEIPAATTLVERAQDGADAAVAVTTGGAAGKKPDLNAQIADAEQKGDWNRAIVLKAQKSNPLVSKG